MKTWQYIVRLIFFRPFLYLLSSLTASFLFYVFPLVPGLSFLTCFLTMPPPTSACGA